MAKIEGYPTIELRVTLSLSESEARALDAMVGYGDDAFVAAFYEHLGESYMKRHETGLRELFKTVRSFIPGILGRVDRAREAFQVK